MAKNDVILIDGIIQERVEQMHPSSDKGEVFEFLACEQVLKEFELTKDEILQGIVDGKDDGGIDALYVFVNGELLSDIETHNFPKRSCEITVVIITCKHHDTFKQDVVNNQCSSISELFNFAKDESELSGNYNADVLLKRKIIQYAYSKTASTLESLNINFHYCSRGDSSCVGESIIARARQIKESTVELFSNSNVQYTFIGSSEILALYRKRPPIEEIIPIIDIISGANECAIVLCNIVEYYKLISDENGKLKKYLFDSNVRDYVGEKGTNTDIMETLNSDGSNIDFWWLNNGITILSTSAINIGKAIKIQNTQIVNGLQTSVSIFKHFSGISVIPNDNRCVMIKIITQNNEEIRDKIIRSTNNQTAIELKSLFATDKIQRDIEDILKKNDMYYERRINHYSNQGISTNQIFDIMYLAAGYVGLVLKAPERAANFKQKSLKTPEKYDAIFNENEDLTIWPVIASVLRRTDNFIIKQNSPDGNREKMVRRSRYVVALITLGRLIGQFNFSSKDLSRFDTGRYSEEEISKTWSFFSPYYDRSKMLIRWHLIRIINEAGKEFSINDSSSFEGRKNIFIDPKQRLDVSPSIVSFVRQFLPKQPWPRGTKYRLIERTGLDGEVIDIAIKRLIKQGVFFKQLDGVLYDKDGQIVNHQ